MKVLYYSIFFIVFHFFSSCGIVDERYESYKETGPAASTSACGGEALTLFSTAFSSTIPTCLSCHGAGQSGSSFLTLNDVDDDNRKSIFKKSRFDGTAFLAKIQGNTHTGRVQAAALDLALVTAWTDKEKECSELTLAGK